LTPEDSSVRTALFWDCQAAADSVFKSALLRLQRDGLALPKGPNLRQKILDPGSGLFRDGKHAEIAQWRDGAGFADHWDGLAFELGMDRPWGVELLKGGGGLVLMIHESESAYQRQRTSPHHATRWAGLLLDLFESARARECLFPLNVAEVPREKWGEAVSVRRKTAELRIAREPLAGPAPKGYSVMTLSAGGALSTSLPVKASP